MRWAVGEMTGRKCVRTLDMLLEDMIGRGEKEFMLSL